jgi:predicted ferric reductase
VTEWLGGLERLYRWHKVLGILAYLALLLHPLALAADSWEESPQQAWSALDPLQQGWPGWLGWAALLGLMVGVGVSLARRLPYDIWRASHWLPGLATPTAALGHTHPCWACRSGPRLHAVAA